MAYARPDEPHWTRERIVAAIAAVVVQALLGLALITGLSVSFRQKAQETLKLFAAEDPPPPPKVQVIPEKKVAATRSEGRASPRNLRSRATPVAAPEPVVVVPLPPPPVIAAPKPFTASDTMSGSSTVRGPGTGAGGIGDGFGSGGNGDGDGGGGGDDTPPEQIRGRLRVGDLPEAIFATGFSGTVGVRYQVLRTGRVGLCRVTRSSGNRAVDDSTCRQIQAAFRFRPTLDENGCPVDAWIVENHTWEIDADVIDER
ncbi:energy transducer TonB [Sphingomonas sp. NBWT7]|uniref:energy transducer TonB n=1 Tax=Sphingomonas sp. NBWT7 TaxID=2596913 RepID=UPI00162AA821|nr:TonB family protein [Sphingomonas sp. NBWT7]